MKAYYKYILVLLISTLSVCKVKAQVGTLTGTGMSQCNLFSFSICPSQTITPFNYGSQGYACNGTTQPDVSFNINGPLWRVNKFNWNFISTENGQISGYNNLGVLQTIPYVASNTITPLSYAGSFVQFAINGIAVGQPLNQTTFSLSLSPTVFGGNSYTYCATTNTNIAISPTLPASGGPWTYNWQPGNMSGSTVTVSPLSNTIYTVTANSPNNCSSTATIAVTVSCSTNSSSCTGSLLFDATHPAVDLPAGNQYYSGTNGGYTWECWFKLNQPFGTDMRPLISAVDGVLYEDQWFGFGWQGGWYNEPVTNLVFKVDGPFSASPTGPNCSYAPPGGYIIGSWYHAAGVMDYTNQISKLFLNGILVDSKPITSPPITRVIPSQLCLNWGGTPLPLYGNMDEVRIWERAVTDAEIFANYDHCLTGNEQNLLVYYRCNQSGSAVTDATPNSNNGSFSNLPSWSTQQAPITGTACATSINFSVTTSSNCISNNNSTVIGTVITNVISPIVSYTWTNSSGIIINQTNNTSSLVDSVSNLGNGIYTLSAQVITSCGLIINTQTLSVNCITTPTLPTAYFSSLDTVCVNQSFSVSNLSTGANSNYWTFCQSNTNSTPQAINLGNVGFFNGPVFISIAKEGTDYYAFVVNNTFGDLTKLFFGSSLLNTPVATNLGNISGVFPGSLEDIHIEYEGGNWYGIVVGGFGGSESVIRIDFGNSLANNAPTAVSYGNIGGLNYPQRLKIFKNGANYYGFTTNRNNNTFTRFDFGTSIANIPTGLNMGNIGALSTPDAIALVNVASLWYGYIINEGNNTITRLDFGNSLLNTPVGINLGNTGALNGPRGIDMWTECNEVRGLITNRFSDDLLNMNLSSGPTGPIVTSSFGNIANFSFPHSITRFRSGDTLFAFITNVSNNTLSRIYYPGCVNSSIASSTLTAPLPISYNTPGNYYINLVINEGQITQTNYCKQITVIASPTVIVSNTTICSGSSASLTASGASFYSWTSSPSLSSITGSFVTATPSSNESYTVTGFIGSCTNTAVSSVTVNPSPIVIITPTISSICAGQTSTLIASGANTYTWNASSTLSASSGSIVVANPINTTIYTVTGTSNTCTNSAITTVSVLAKPTIILSPNSSICQGTNTSATLTANGASTYTWVNSSTLSSSTGSIVIASPNATTNYTVTGSNSACSNTAIITVSVNPTPTITSTTFSNTTCGLSNGSATVTSIPSTNTYSWSSGLTSTTSAVNALVAGNYSVIVYNGTCQTNTVVSILSSVPLQIVSNTITGSDCGVNNGSILVNDNLVSSSYSWTPNLSSSNNLSNLSPGTYSLLITNGVCTTTAAYNVPQLYGPSAINVIQSDAICESLSGAISVTSVSNGVGPYQFSVNNLGYSSVSSFSNLAQGVYTITVKDFNGCIYSNTVVINKVSVTSTIDLITNLPTCNTNDGSFVINNISGGTKPYSFSFNGLSYTTDTLFEELGSGNYVLVIKDSNLCETNLMLNMTFDKNDYTLYVPNSFTPNKDVVNDVWFVKGTCINSFNCLIFNRWGERIMELVNINETWDGTFKGKNVPDGVYVYLIEAETNNGTIYRNGHIIVFR